MIVCLMLCIAGSVYALDGVFFGIGAEANANTRDGAAAGGGLSFGLALNQSIALGVKAVYSNNLDTISNVEPAAFFRYYLPLGGLFVQADAGGSIFFEDGKNYPSLMGGLTAGWRFNLGDKFYAEPAVRGGYPFVWGAGITAGIRIAMNNEKGAMSNEE